MKKGKIVLLNGVSSAGKTTLGRELQKKSDEPFYWLANDTFVDMLPSKCWDADPAEYGSHALLMLNRAAKMFSDEGKNVIVDHVILNTEKRDLFKDFILSLRDNPVLLVNVVCPISELERREKERGDRNIGQAVGQLNLLNPQDGYDIIVDTFNTSISNCAEDIIAMLSNSMENTALNRFHHKFTNV